MLLLPAIVAGPIRAETAQICVNEDTWFSESNKGKNGAQSKWLVTKGSTGDRIRTLLGFDISSLPAGASVTTATVSLWVIDPDPSGVTVRRMTNSWTEDGATWQNTANAFSAAVEASFTPNVEKFFRTFDIASLVQKWLDGTYSNYGIMLVANSTGDEATFASREAQTASQRPCMTVTYSLGPAVESNRFEIRHDGSGVHCSHESFSVIAETVSNATLISYANTITLTTQTGVGTFTSASTNNGSFSDVVANDGVASYTFHTLDAGGARFFLNYSGGAGGAAGSTVDVDAYQSNYPALRDDDSEGLLRFAPGGFTITSRALPNPPPNPVFDPIGSQTAGVDFKLHLAAYGTAPSDPECGVIESYAGDKPVRFWIGYGDPSAAPFVPTIDGNTIAASEAGAASQTVRFSQGQAVVTARYRDVGRITIQALDSSGTTSVRGASGSFVSRPADLAIVAVTTAQGDSNPGLSTPTGVPFARAGEPFQVRVEARGADGQRAPSYGRESVAERIRLQSSTLVAPIGGRNGTLNDGAIANADVFAAIAPDGTFTGSTFAFDEVGAIRLRASVADGDYLGAGPVVGTESGTVGRFAPSHFTVTANSPRFATACPTGAFTWLGQPFSYATGFAAQVVVTAVNRASTTTQNYAGTWFRLSNATLARRSYRAGGATVDESGLPAATLDPTITSNGDGSARLSFSTGAGIALSRGTPQAPFGAEIELSIDILDADATAYPTNPFRVGGTTAGAGIAFDTSKRFQFGRLRLDNAYGSELVKLPMRLRVQRFDGTAFADDDSDSCSRVPASALLLTPSPAKLSAQPSLKNVPLFSGDAGLSFAAPGAPGEIALRINLGATGANLPWLRSDWPDDGNLDGVLDDDPQARATFGIWEGRDALIFVRELY